MANHIISQNEVTVSGLARVVEGIKGWVENSAASHSAYRVHSAEEWAIIFADDPEAPDLGNYVFDAKYVNSELQGIKESIVEAASATSADMEVISAALNDLDDRINATSGKADKVTGATSGHLAMLDSDGDLDDSGIPMSSVSGALEKLREIEPCAQVNVIESVKLGETELTPESRVVTIPLFNGSVNGAVVAPPSASQINNAFLSGTGSWNEMTPVTNAKIDEMFIETITIGGRNYHIIKIGNQLWMTENLDFKYEGITIGGSAISDSTPLANYYNNDETTYGINGNKYGLLYNGASVNLMQTNASTIFPTGWNIASVSDYTTLFNYVGSYRKLRSTSGWTGTQGTDEFGFNAVPSGQRNAVLGDWAYRQVGTLAKYWTRTIVGPYNGYAYIDQNNSGGTVDGDARSMQLAVRLVKNLT